MFRQLIPLLFLSLLSIKQAEAQSGTISVGPLLTCGLTTFSCPGTGGCCTIAGCCGSGCCANGYTCINEGTSSEACCSSFDSTKCGTVTPSSGSGSGSGSGSSDKTCTRIQNCPRDPVRGLAWTCVLGKTCGFSYPDCNPCPYIGGSSSSSGGSSGSDSGSDSGSSGSDSGSSRSDSSGEDSTTSSSSSTFFSSSSTSSSSPASSGSSTSSTRSSASSSSTSSSTGSVPNSGRTSRKFGLVQTFLTVFAVEALLCLVF